MVFFVLIQILLPIVHNLYFLSAVFPLSAQRYITLSTSVQTFELSIFVSAVDPVYPTTFLAKVKPFFTIDVFDTNLSVSQRIFTSFGI